MQRGGGRTLARRGARLTGHSGTTAAIIAAGGRGERAGGPKQFRLLGGRPLLVWSLDLFAPLCDELVVVAPAALLETARDALRGYPEARIVGGGESRQESVARGLQTVGSEVVLVHDGARPFASEGLVRRVLAALESADAVIPALPLEETIKRVDEEQVGETVPRDGIWRVQTPQVFRTEALRAAHERARLDSFTGTDDAQLVERMGGTVVVVTGERANIKLTYAEDFELAEAYARARTSGRAELREPWN